MVVRVHAEVVGLPLREISQGPSRSQAHVDEAVSLSRSGAVGDDVAREIGFAVWIPGERDDLPFSARSEDEQKPDGQARANGQGDAAEVRAGTERTLAGVVPVIVLNVVHCSLLCTIAGLTWPTPYRIVKTMSRTFRMP